MTPKNCKKPSFTKPRRRGTPASTTELTPPKVVTFCEALKNPIFWPAPLRAAFDAYKAEEPMLTWRERAPREEALSKLFRETNKEYPEARNARHQDILAAGFNDAHGRYTYLFTVFKGQSIRSALLQAGLSKDEAQGVLARSRASIWAEMDGRRCIIPSAANKIQNNARHAYLKGLFCSFEDALADQFHAFHQQGGAGHWSKKSMLKLPPTVVSLPEVFNACFIAAVTELGDGLDGVNRNSTLTQATEGFHNVMRPLLNKARPCDPPAHLIVHDLLDEEVFCREFTAWAERALAHHSPATRQQLIKKTLDDVREQVLIVHDRCAAYRKNVTQHLRDIGVRYGERVFTKIVKKLAGILAASHTDKGAVPDVAYVTQVAADQCYVRDHLPFVTATT